MMSGQDENPSGSTGTPHGRAVSRWNLPNLLSFTRLVGAFVLVVVAFVSSSQVFLGLFIVLLATDWFDGRLARWLDVKTTFGARLDSIADAAMYTALLVGTCWLKWDVVKEEAPWLIAAAASYALTSGAGLWKYGRVPSYHTRAAKTCWFLVGVSAIFVFADWSVWPMRITAAGGVLTNLEALAITCVLPAYRVNVTSLYHAVYGQAGEEGDAAETRGESGKPKAENGTGE